MDVTMFSRSALLRRISLPDLEALMRGADERRWNGGALLFGRGDPGDALYAIVSGRVTIFVDSVDGAEVVLATRNAGDMIGEMAVLSRTERSTGARAHGPVAALRISREQFDAWLRERPNASRALLEELAQRLREATDQVAEIALLSVETRVARRLWRLFSGASGEQGPSTGIRLQVNQTELAAALGITRESVNKHLAKLKARNIVSVDAGRIALLDADALRALSEDTL